MKAGRNAIIRRTARLILMLRGRRYMPAILDLSVQLECTERTVYRYLDAIESAGYILPRRQMDGY